MLFPPSIERTVAFPGVSQQALLVVSPDGRIQFATARALSWLKEFSYSPSNRGPQTFAGWLDGAVASSRPSWFYVNRGGTEFSLRVIHREPTAICLLLEQRAEISGKQAGGRRLLTERETEVLSWVARGKTNAEIARIMRLKTGTIGKYLERIFPKLGVENRTAAASFVLGTNRAA
jgi:DNA-binding CsgD family transcriptional regulator